MTAAAPLVSAIVSTYNAERFLRGCLEDLEAQTIADSLEVIVVDSGSQQNERAIATEFQARNANVRYLRTPERETVYAAWNRAIAVARGEYVTNANTDDRHRRDAFERMAGVLDDHPEIALVYADQAVTEVENATLETAPVVAHFRWPDFEVELLDTVPCIGPQPMWRRSLHERYGLFDASFEAAGDYEWWRRIAPTEVFFHLPEVLGLYLFSPTSAGHRDRALTAREVGIVQRRYWRGEGDPRTLSEDFLVAAPGQYVAQYREAAIRELRAWARELEAANAWLEEQRATWERIACERAAWIEELEAAKEWLAEQRDNWERVAQATAPR